MPGSDVATSSGALTAFWEDTRKARGEPDQERKVAARQAAPERTAPLQRRWIVKQGGRVYWVKSNAWRTPQPVRPVLAITRLRPT